MSEKYETLSINAIPSIQRWVWFSELLSGMQMDSILFSYTQIQYQMVSLVHRTKQGQILVFKRTKPNILLEKFIS